ncbi:MAG: AtpZ/AtpI family protein [Acidimicrobiia bacterium]|nr:AtpZ/AtpI family protein [Acidimicrobiia bacterium]
MDVSQRRELTEDMRRGSSSFELVFAPLLLALIGFGLDSLLGWVPVLTVTFAVLGAAGAGVRLYYGYATEMAAHEAGAPWAKRS